MEHSIPNNVYDLASRLSSNRNSATDQKAKELQAMTRLLRTLQSTLDLSQILEIFSNELNALIPIDGLAYNHAESDAQFETAAQGRHRVSYELKIDNEQLGTISFTRNKRFTEAELQTVEEVLSCIPYPLRNALQYREAMRAASIDALTGSGNRVALESALHREIDLAKRDEIPFSLVMFDFDHFKHINDTHGHPCGDMVLKQSVLEIQRSLRKTDLLFRYGGEEFVLLLHKTGAEQAEVVAEKVREKIQSLQLEHEGNQIDVSASLGVAALDDEDGISSLIERADRALYQAKNAGRNRVCVG